MRDPRLIVPLALWKNFRVPGQSKPLEVFAMVVRNLRSRATLVDVFDSKQEGALLLSHTQPCRRKGQHIA